MPAFSEVNPALNKGGSSADAFSDLMTRTKA